MNRFLQLVTGVDNHGDDVTATEFEREIQATANMVDEAPTPEPKPLTGASVAKVKAAHETGLRGMLAARDKIVDEIERLQDQLAQTELCISTAEDSIKKLSTYKPKIPKAKVPDFEPNRHKPGPAVDRVTLKTDNPIPTPPVHPYLAERRARDRT